MDARLVLSPLQSWTLLLAWIALVSVASYGARWLLDSRWRAKRVMARSRRPWRLP